MLLPSLKIILCHLHCRRGQAALTYGGLSLAVLDSPGHLLGWPLHFPPLPYGFLSKSLTYFPNSQVIELTCEPKFRLTQFCSPEVPLQCFH